MDIKDSLGEKEQDARETFGELTTEKPVELDQDSITTTYGTYLSSDKSTTIEYMCIAPQGEPKQVLQFMHGMAEYKERYTLLGEYLASRGIAFYINDHIGHGRSSLSPEHLGYFGGSKAWMNMVYDAKVLTDIARATYPNTPFNIGGHSMGSLTTRAYLAAFPNIPGKAILVGTCNSNMLSALGKTIAKLIGFFKGKMYRSQFLNVNTFGSYNKKISNPATPYDWLSVDKENVEKYIGDPLCGFTFTTDGFENLAGLITYVSRRSIMTDYNKHLPVYIAYGKGDPVGHFGKDIKKLARELKSVGLANVSICAYSGLRHEIFQESAKYDIYKNLADWLLAELPTIPIVPENNTPTPSKVVASEDIDTEIKNIDNTSDEGQALEYDNNEGIALEDDNDEGINEEENLTETTQEKEST